MDIYISIYWYAYQFLFICILYQVKKKKQALLCEKCNQHTSCTWVTQHPRLEDKKKVEIVLKKCPTNQFKQFDPKNHIVYWHALPSASLANRLTDRFAPQKNGENCVKIAQTKAEINLKLWVDVPCHAAESCFSCLM